MKDSLNASFIFFLVVIISFSAGFSTVHALDTISGYICNAGTLDCNQETASFILSKQNTDTYLVCTLSSVFCNTTNALYTVVKNDRDSFYICKGGFPICNVGNGDYYMEKNDSTSYYICKGNLPVCNVANGNYYLEKDTSTTWNICEGSMPVCNSTNNAYIFQKVVDTPPVKEEDNSYAPQLTTLKVPPSKLVAKTQDLSDFVSEGSSTSSNIYQNPVSTTSTTTIIHKIESSNKSSAFKRFITWVFSFLKK